MEELKSVCKNPWCKGTFVYKESDMVPVEQNIKKSNFVDNSEKVEKVAPSICPKCKSLETEMSGGIEWKTKEFEGSRFDGLPHEVRYKVTNYKL